MLLNGQCLGRERTIVSGRKMDTEFEMGPYLQLLSEAKDHPEDQHRVFHRLDGITLRKQAVGLRLDQRFIKCLLIAEHRQEIIVAKLKIDGVGGRFDPLAFVLFPKRGDF